MERILSLLAALLISVSLMGQDGKVFHAGIETSVDCFAVSGGRISPSIGLGALVRLGRDEQWINLVGGVRYIYGMRLSGFQIPVLLDVNLLRGGQFSAYLGGGYEFDFIGSYLGCTTFNTGLRYGRLDMRVFYKPYQGDLGAGLAYYF